MKIAIMSTFPAILPRIFISRHLLDLEKEGICISNVIIDEQKEKKEAFFRHAFMVARRQGRIANCLTLTSLLRILVWKMVNSLTSKSCGERLIGFREIVTPVFVPNLNSQITVNEMKNANPDLICLMGARKLTPDTLEKLNRKVINIHSSDPRFVRGGPVVVWEILAGKAEITLTIHEVAAELDAGAILVQENHPIVYHKGLGATIQETMKSAQEKVADLFLNTILGYKECSLKPVVFVPGQLCVTPKVRETIYAEYLCRKRAINS